MFPKKYLEDQGMLPERGDRAFLKRRIIVVHEPSRGAPEAQSLTGLCERLGCVNDYMNGDTPIYIWAGDDEQILVSNMPITSAVLDLYERTVNHV